MSLVTCNFLLNIQRKIIGILKVKLIGPFSKCFVFSLLLFRLVDIHWNEWLAQRHCSHIKHNIWIEFCQRLEKLRCKMKRVAHRDLIFKFDKALKILWMPGLVNVWTRPFTSEAPRHVEKRKVNASIIELYILQWAVIDAF